MIRPAKAEDADFIAAVYKEHKRNLGSFNLYQCWYAYLNSGKGKYDVYPGVGFVRYAWSPRKSIWVLHDIGVVHSAQGNGYGRALMARVPRPFMLKCNQSNVNANDFYVKQGLKLTGLAYTLKGVIQNVYLCAE